MLESPDLPEEKIIACLQDSFGLPVLQVTFLPLGADLNTAVYRAVGGEGTSYFVKLRGGVFDPITVTLPKYLSDQGLRQIIPPLATRTGQLWAELAPYKLILYPFVEGRDGYRVRLSERHWRDLGMALKKLHTTKAPPALLSGVRRETYSHRWRETVVEFMERLEQGAYPDPVAAEAAAFLQVQRAGILDLAGRAGRLARALRAQPPKLVLCHADIHAGNVLIDPNDWLYIVDWDDPILAPKERDLMYIGGAQGFLGHTPQEEEALFYRGYGPAQVNPLALAYYRYERIVQDIAIYCEQLLLSNEGGEDRAQSLHYLKSNFLPGGTIEVAYQSELT